MPTEIGLAGLSRPSRPLNTPQRQKLPLLPLANIYKSFAFSRAAISGRHWLIATHESPFCHVVNAAPPGFRPNKYRQLAYMHAFEYSTCP